jgi:hypothetical protein
MCNGRHVTVILGGVIIKNKMQLNGPGSRHLHFCDAGQLQTDSSNDWSPDRKISAMTGLLTRYDGSTTDLQHFDAMHGCQQRR